MDEKGVINRDLGAGGFVLLVLIACIFFEFAGVNRNFTISALSNLPTKILQIDDAILANSGYQNNTLTAYDPNPRMVFEDVDQKVRGIDINCVPTGDDNDSQIFYSTDDESFSEDRSVIFSLTEDDNVVFLPKTLLVSDLRFDLANDKNETLFCTDIVLNPEINYRGSYLRFFGYALLIGISAFLSLRLSKQNLENKLDRWAGWIIGLFGLLIVWVDLNYPVVFTYDSGHYLWLSELIISGDFANWDIIRNLVFPLHLSLSKVTFTDSNIGLQIPMVIYHIGLYLSLCLLIRKATGLNKGYQKIVLSMIVILFIVLDPTVTGYYHAVLTEYMAATLAATACLLAIILYESNWYSKSYWQATILLIIISVIGWHIKQPYLGIGAFPLFVGYLLKLLKKSKPILWLQACGMAIILVVLVLGTTFLWEGFLSTRGNALDVNRQFGTWFVNQISNQTNETPESNTNFLKQSVKKYLTSSNFFDYDPASKKMINSPSLIRAGQNRQIAQNIYTVGSDNTIAVADFAGFVENYYEVNDPPETLNNLKLSRINVSNFAFTIGYLTLPILLLFFFVWWVRKKDLVSASGSVLAGSAFLNAIIHTVSGAGPLDRYFFWGYPLILAAWICGLIAFGHLVVTRYQSSGKMVEKATK